jgi:tetratricopeptide (TPR) repeat protein
MIADRQGNSVSGANTQAASLYDEAVAAFNLYRGDPIGLLDRALQEAPEFAMAHIAKIVLMATATEPAAMDAAIEMAPILDDLTLNERERSYRNALGHLFNGDWTRAGRAFDYHSMQFPLDLLALQTGHLIDFFCANNRNLRDRPARALTRWTPDIPGYSVVLGMQAFGLEEAGDYARAEALGREAVAAEPLDCWAHHAVAHVMEMQGRAEDGIGWMLSRQAYWGADDNMFKVHNWWHRAVCHLSLEQFDEALALYDGPIREARSAVALDVIDAAALLWRLHLAGVDTGDRWGELADAWLPLADGTTYPFNDWHAAMALLGAGRTDEVQRIKTALRNPDVTSETGRWSREIGLPLVEGFEAFWHGDFNKAADTLYGARPIANAFGGSHAQRDIIDLTLLEAALRGSNTDMARALADERLSMKPCSAMNRAFLSRLGVKHTADARTG